jgi:hypothetical protein
VERQAKRALSALLAVALMLGTAASAAGGLRASGREQFHGGLVVSGASGKRTVVGSVIAMSGVFNGVGRIVERPNRPGDSNRMSRDDLVFPAGTLHIVNTNGRTSFAMSPRTCTVSYKAQQTSTIEGGTGRFAGATGNFKGTLTGSGLVRRKPNGNCDTQSAGLAEIDTVSGAGALSF